MGKGTAIQGCPGTIRVQVLPDRPLASAVHLPFAPGGRGLTSKGRTTAEPSI